MKILQILFVSLLVFALASSCKDDEAPGGGTNCDPSYKDDIKPIIDSSCALSGCHVSGFANGDYSSYEGVKANVDDGSMRTQVVVTMDMPLPNGQGPDELTQEQIDLFDCWIENGAEDN